MMEVKRPLLGLLVVVTVANDRCTGSEDAVATTMSAADVRPYPAASSPFARLRVEGIRAMSKGAPEKLAAAGFNLALPWERLLTGSKKTAPPDSPFVVRGDDFSEQVVERLREWALRCRKSNVITVHMIMTAAEGAVRHLAGIEPRGGHLLDYIGYGNRDPLTAKVKKVWPAHQYRRVVDWNGEPARWAPCPLERRYWIGFIRPQLELVARVLRESGAAGGAALELETYCFYSIYPGMASQKKAFCYCDHCFYGFVRSMTKGEAPDAVLPAKRFDWLTQRGLLLDYEDHLEDSMSDIIEEMMLEVRKINPEFLFGFYPYAPFWYYDALIRGSGTPELPCLLFSSAEYRGGYKAGPSAPTFFGDASTASSLAHLRRRKLPAMYVGGLYDRGMNSPDAVATAMDRMLRGPDGYWVYRELRDFQIWEPALAMNQWTRDNPGPLVASELSQNAMAAAVDFVAQNKPDGIVVSDGRIVATYDGQPSEVRVIGGSFDSDGNVAEGWQGRGSLPPVDTSTGNSSMLFEPSTASKGPRTPYIDQKIADAKEGQSYELSCRVKTAGARDPVRFWVGKAGSSQYPAYMWYTNYVLPPDRDWTPLQTLVSFEGTPPLVLRFWCPPTDGKLWLDDVTLRPVQARIIHIPLVPPDNATGWRTVRWKLAPPDARCDAMIIDANDGHALRTRLYAGDSLAPLAAIGGLKPVVLHLTVYPSAAEPVSLEEVQVGFTRESR